LHTAVHDCIEIRLLILLSTQLVLSTS